MTSYKPLIYSLIFILVIGFIFGFLVVEFSDQIDLIEPDGFLNSTIVFIDEGVDIELFDFNFFGFDVDTLNFNFFDIFPETFKDFIVNSLTLMALVPLAVLIPILVLMAVGIGWSVWAMIRGM